MNNPSPLLPQGSLLEQKDKGRARVKIAVFVVLAIHGIGLLALLMQGCKKEPDTTSTADQATNTSPAAIEPPAPPTNDTNIASMPATNVTPEIITPPGPPATPADYKVVQGDTFSTIAKKFHVSVNALMAANPGTEPTKLQIGQTLHVPPPATTAASTTSSTAAANDTAAGESMYTVKSGDTLTSIAAQYKVTVKALRSTNNLTTDRIRVGQKLKIPSKPDTGTNGTASTATPTGK